jgi:multiple sugar transport system permease protein
MAEASLKTGKVKPSVDPRLVRPPFLVRARPYLVIAPALLLLIGILYPFFLAMYYSFTSYTLTRPIPKFVGLANYIAMVVDPGFLHTTAVTFGYAIGATGVELLLGLVVALLLDRETRVAKILTTTLIFPMMIAPVIGTLLWKLMMQPSVGILNPMLSLIGISGLEWAAKPSTALPSVIMIDVWIYTPFVALLLLAGLRALPREPFEAARVDGASRWFTFRNLTLPMLYPIMIIAVVFRFMDSLNMFDVIYAMTGGGPGDALMTYQLQAYYKGYLYMNLSSGLTYTIVLWAIIYVVSQYLVKFWNKAQQRAAGM